ncbi:MAG: hypothetical protein AAGD23_07740 [Pseudomonadota bacterium]
MPGHSEFERETPDGLSGLPPGLQVAEVTASIPHVEETRVQQILRDVLREAVLPRLVSRARYSD